jgi:hypothetical protein
MMKIKYMKRIPMFKTSNHLGMVMLFAAAACGSFGLLSIGKIWHDQAHEQMVQTDSQMAAAKKTIDSIQKDIALLHNYKQKFLASMSSIEKWMEDVSPLVKNEAIKTAQKAQDRMISYISREMNKIEERFASLPTQNDVEGMRQKVAALLTTPAPQQTMMAHAQHPKMLRRMHTA